jgi:hypothetical protein
MTHYVTLTTFGGNALKFRSVLEISVGLPELELGDDMKPQKWALRGKGIGRESVFQASRAGIS